MRSYRRRKSPLRNNLAGLRIKDHLFTEAFFSTVTCRIPSWSPIAAGRSAGGAPPSPGRLFLARLHRSGRPLVLRKRVDRKLSVRSGLRGQNPQRRETERASRPGSRKVRAGDQPQDR
jgi:hypothetical protein